MHQGLFCTINLQIQYSDLSQNIQDTKHHELSLSLQTETNRMWRLDLDGQSQF